MSDAVVACINMYTLRHTPPAIPPVWLDEIDAFFPPPAVGVVPEPTARHGQGTAGFVKVCMLLTPLISFDAILTMHAFDDEFLTHMEIAFLTRLAVPRNVEEAQRMYAVILALPTTYVCHTQRGRHVVPQPFKAQMCFAALITRPSTPHTALWNFQRACLEQCPTRLLDYSDDWRQGYSTRPAFWMAHAVRDPTFREILLRRGSDLLRADVTRAWIDNQKRAAAAAAVATEMPSVQRPLVDRVPAPQRELAALLQELERYLAAHAQDLYDTLRPGVHDEQIDKLNTVLAPLKLSEDMATLYKWHNGVAHRGFLFGYPDLMALEEAVYWYREILATTAMSSWCAAWFPCGFECQIYRLVPLSEMTVQEAPLLQYDIVGGDIEVQHTSLKHMIATYLQAYKEGVVYVDALDDCWTIHPERFDAMRLHYSPGAYRSPEHTQGVYDAYDASQWPALWQKYWIRHD